jgi:hypothetical protein
LGGPAEFIAHEKLYDLQKGDVMIKDEIVIAGCKIEVI